LVVNAAEPVIGAKPSASTRYNSTKPAAFDAVDRKAVTGVGAPSYTSGDHE